MCLFYFCAGRPIPLNKHWYDVYDLGQRSFKLRAHTKVQDDRYSDKVCGPGFWSFILCGYITDVYSMNCGTLKNIVAF